MKLTKIETIPEDTGLRALVLWDKEGEVTFGELPEGIAPSKTESGGIYIRRIRERVTMSIRGAVTTTRSQQLPIPTGYRASAPFPITSITVPSAGTLLARVGSGLIYVSIPLDTLVSGNSASYAATISWDATQDLPHPNTYPGLPA